MYRNLTGKEDTLQKIVAEMKNEYFRGMNNEENEKQDLMIGYSDLTVWYYNRDCQRALPEIKRVWDSVESNRMGMKSLYFI